jgi:hypothetical protein
MNKRFFKVNIIFIFFIIKILKIINFNQICKLPKNMSLFDIFKNTRHKVLKNSSRLSEIARNINYGQKYNISGHLI